VVGVEFSLLFLAIPIGAWCVGGFVVASNYADLHDKGLPFAKIGSPGRHLGVYYVLSATHPVFCLVLWLQVASLEERYGTLGGNVRSTLIWIGAAFSWAAVVAIASQASTIRVRLSQFVGEDFGRVLILTVTWSGLTVFGVAVALVGMGRISAVLETATALTAAQTHQVMDAALGFAMGASGALIGVVWAAKVRDLSIPKNFARALSRTQVGVAPVLVGVLWALLNFPAA
jgi:hypothetical protein